MLRQRSPRVAAGLLRRLEDEDVQGIQCFEDLAAARAAIVAEGFDACPTWREIWDGARPKPPVDAEPGEWRHGWQFHASSAREKWHRQHQVRPMLDAAGAVLLDSQSGRCSGRHLTLIPTNPESTFTAERFRALL